MHRTSRLLLVGAVCALAACNSNSPNEQAPGAEQGMKSGTGTARDEAADAQTLVGEARLEVLSMKADPRLMELLNQARGVYIVPEYGQGALIVGGSGGAGLVIAKIDGHWSPPAFFNFGSLSFGAQAGGSGGQIAFILMNDKALNAFRSGNTISLDAGAGLSIVDYSTDAQASLGDSDIVMWSDTEGAYAGATISVSDINWDDGKNRAFYGKAVSPQDVFTGKVATPGTAKPLLDALP